MPGFALLKTLKGDRQGSVAIETALVIPLACLIMVGFWETYSYVRSVALIERAAYSVANMMSRQQASLQFCREDNDALNLGTYITAAEKITAPLTLGKNGMVILSGVNGPGGVATVAWQRRSDYTIDNQASILGTVNAAPRLAGGIVPTSAADTVLVAEIIYRYRPFAMTAGFWPDAPGQVTIARQAYYRGRTANLSTLVAGAAPCTPLTQP